jgi:hypothetical protein
MGGGSEVWYKNSLLHHVGTFNIAWLWCWSVECGVNLNVLLPVKLVVHVLHQVDLE